MQRVKARRRRRKATLRDLLIALGIKRTKAIVMPSGGDRLELDFEISPHEFLAQAAVDLQSEGRAALFNSITNSRRAILCEMDRVLGALGFRIEIMTTKSKTDLLRFLGLPTPNILRKVGQTRNELEHEYKIPPQDKVEDALDIAVLFVHAMDRHLETFWGDFYLGNEGEEMRNDFGFQNEVLFYYDPKKKNLRATGVRCTENPAKRYSSKRDVVGEALLSSEDPEFKHCIRLALLEYINLPTKDAMAELFDALAIP